MSRPPLETDSFIAELDAAVESHMNWTRRILRCVVLRTAPADDVADRQAHTLCRFGGWFAANRSQFEMLDALSTGRVDAVHQAMHDAIRSICNDVMAGRPGREGDLDAFEQSQAELLGLLARFKTLILSREVRSDPLTGLPLRDEIENDFLLAQKEGQRNGTLLYVVMIDVDHFKRVNDRYGHLTGDRVLMRVAQICRECLREVDVIARYGGEIFRGNKVLNVQRRGAIGCILYSDPYDDGYFRGFPSYWNLVAFYLYFLQLPQCQGIKACRHLKPGLAKH